VLAKDNTRKTDEILANCCIRMVKVTIDILYPAGWGLENGPVSFILAGNYGCNGAEQAHDLLNKLSSARTHLS